MSTPAMIYLLLCVLGAGISMEQSGKPKTGKHSFSSFLIGQIIGLSLLYWGGFFSVVPK